MTPPRVRPAPGTIFAIVLGAAVPLAFVGVFFAWPVLAMVGRGFFVDGALDLGGFVEVLARPRTLRLIGLTVGQAALAAVICVLLGLPMAHVLYRLKFRGQRMLRALVILPFVLPTVVVGVAFRTLLRDGGLFGGLGLDGTFTAIMLALVFFNVAVVVRTVGTSWEGLDSRQEEAARVLGAGPARVWFTVTLPRLAPAIVSAASIVFLFCSTAFGVVLVLGGTRFGTIETEIYLLTTQFLDLRGASVLSVTQLVVVVLLLLLAARARGRRTALRRVDAALASRRPRLGDGPAIAVTLVVAVLLALPIVALVLRSLQTSDGWGIGNYLALGTTGSRNALVVTVWVALGNSLTIAVQATLVALVIGLAAALVISRQPRSRGLRRALAGFDGALMLPLGVSAVTVGFGFLITLNQPPFDLRSSPILVPIAQALVALPLVVRTILPVLTGIDGRLRESASVLGAGPGRVLRDVDLAIVARPVLAASGFAFAVALGEFGATSFLSRPDRPTLPVVIFRLIGLPGGDNFGMALAASVVLAAVTVGVIALVERLRVGTMGAF
ncbi:thiamine transport system permease protein [Conyzicola lurida]|uniref:Thiamine transport system permease protein n=1 Tax=Conyzicola lurida TaxID=1172621 RepID=A0A841AQ14_9MICO|nr:thiamine transport system permease protein [Conyzicola lurida]